MLSHWSWSNLEIQSSIEGSQFYMDRVKKLHSLIREKKVFPDVATCFCTAMLLHNCSRFIKYDQNAMHAKGQGLQMKCLYTQRRPKKEKFTMVENYI